MAEFTEEQITALITKQLEGFSKPLTEQLTSFGGILKELQNKPAPKVEPPPVVTEDKKKTPQENAEIAELRRNLDTITKKQTDTETRREAAEKKVAEQAREQKIRGELQKYNFTNDEAASDAYSLVNGQIVQDEAGNLLGPGNLPVDAFLKDYLPTKKAYLLSKTGANGGGATGGQKIGPAGQATLEEIKPGMAPERLAAVGRSIREALAAQGQQ